ncbi:MAG: hypothetical protein ACR2KX_17800 [Chitinophagaceae bacterium]
MYFCNMITDQEQLFINYWKDNRDKQKKGFYQLAIGLPLGLVFAFPVLLSVIFHDWYKQMTFISNSQITIILITVLGIAVFFALFRMKFKWEENEQRYKELKFKQSKTE